MTSSKLEQFGEWVYIWLCFVLLNDTYREYCYAKQNPSENKQLILDIEKAVSDKGGNLSQFYDDWGDVYSRSEIISEPDAFLEWLEPRCHLFDLPRMIVRPINEHIGKRGYIARPTKYPLKQSIKSAIKNSFEPNTIQKGPTFAPYKIITKGNLESDKLKAFRKSFVAYSYFFMRNLETGKNYTANEALDDILDMEGQELFYWSAKLLRDYSNVRVDTKSNQYRKKTPMLYAHRKKGIKYCETSIYGFIDIRL